MRRDQDLNQVLCTTCGSGGQYALYYDEKVEDYICSKCLDKEREKEEASEDEEEEITYEQWHDKYGEHDDGY